MIKYLQVKKNMKQIKMRRCETCRNATKMVGNKQNPFLKVNLKNIKKTHKRNSSQKNKDNS